MKMGSSPRLRNTHPQAGSTIEGHAAYVFCNAQGQLCDNVRKSLLAAASEAGIEGGIALHPLRHAFCSHALMQGIDPRTVQK
jgi:site-specific recombinase XerD